MTLKLNGSTDGSVSIDAPADTSPSGSDITLTLPTTVGSAEQFLKNSGTAGELEFSNMVETSSGIELANNTGLLIDNTGGTARRVIHVDTDNNVYLNSNPQNNSIIFQSGGADEAARIDTSGRLLVGLTSAREHLNDGSDSAQVFVEGTTQNTSTLAVIRSSNNDGPAHLVLGKSRGGVGSTTVVQDGDTVGHINFEAADGNHLIRAGQISCVIDDTPGGNDMPGRLSFSVTPNGSNNLKERLRINHKGFLKAGPRITDGSHGVANLDSARHEFTSDDNGWTMIVTHTSGAASEHEGILIDYENSPNGSGNSFIQGNDSNGLKFRFASNGGLYNYQGNNSNLSDEREKKNIVDLDTKWDKVKSWDLKKFHYNEDDDDDDLRYGVIAQQVEQHCPEVLTDWIKQSAKDAVLDEDGNVVTPAVAEVTRKGVKEQQMMWMAIKALQEAQTRIETLETQNTAQQAQIDDLLTRVTALEAAE